MVKGGGEMGAGGRGTLRKWIRKKMVGSYDEMMGSNL